MAVAQSGSCSSDLTSSLGISICHKYSPEKKGKKKKEEEEEETSKTRNLFSYNFGG